MASQPVAAHAEPVVDIIVLACTALAFLTLLAAVPMALRESRQDENEIRSQR
jgi:hypothetical protein